MLSFGFLAELLAFDSIWMKNTKAPSKRHHLVTMWPKVVEFKDIACSRKEILNTTEATDIVMV